MSLATLHAGPSAPGVPGDPTVVLDLPFATTKSLTATKGPTPSFSRASTGTYFDSNGILQTAAINVPRFDHFWDGTTWVCRGLRIDGQSTNYCLWNRDLTNAVWTASNVTTAKDQTGIDGVANSASSVTATANNGTISQTFTSASRMHSFFIKRLSGTGVIDYSVNNGTSYTTITATSGSWVRIYPHTSAQTTTTIIFRIGTSGDSIGIDFVQTEFNPDFAAGVAAPIETTSAAVTQSADICNIVPFSVWNSSEGSVLVSAFVPNTNTSLARNIFNADDNNLYSDAYRIRNQNAFYFFENSGAGIGLSISRGSAPNQQLFKIAGRYKLNDAALVASYNTTPAYDTTFTPSTAVAAFRVGHRVTSGGVISNSNMMYGCISQVKLWNVAKIDADLLGLVT